MSINKLILKVKQTVVVVAMVAMLIIVAIVVSVTIITVFITVSLSEYINSHTVLILCIFYQIALLNQTQALPFMAGSNHA